MRSRTLQGQLTRGLAARQDNDVQPSRDLAVPGAMSRLSERLKEQADLLSNLESRLAPVLRCEPADPIGKCETPGYPSGLSGEIHQFCDQAEMVNVRISKLIEGLEI